MEQPPPITPQVWDIAKRLFELTWQHYMQQIESIQRDDYVAMQSAIGYPETYEKHMARLVDGVPHNPRIMVTHIANFITQYIEFQDPKYAAKIEQVIESVRNNREAHKQKAFEILMQQNAERDPTIPVSTEIDFHPPLFELTLGTQQITLPTFGNPMMTALYSLLFLSFAHFQNTEIDQSVSSGQ